MGKFKRVASTWMESAVVLLKLTQLEQVLLRRMPQSVHMLVLCRIALKQKYPKGTLVEFYRYANESDSSEDDDSSWHHDSNRDSFILCIQRPNTYTKKGTIFLPPEREVTDDMIKTFDEFIGWDTPQIFQSVPDPFSKIISDLCISHQNAFKDGSCFCVV